MSRLAARQFNGDLAPVRKKGVLLPRQEQIVWKEPLPTIDQKGSSCCLLLVRGGRTVRTTDPDPDYSCPGHGVEGTSAVLSQLTEHGADRLSLITFVDQHSPGDQQARLFAWLQLYFTLPAQSVSGTVPRLGPARERQREMPKGNVSECGMYERYETEIRTAGSTKASRSSFVAASVASSPFPALPVTLSLRSPWQTKA